MNGIQKYWAQFSPEQRAKMMKARLKKWSPAAKKKWGGKKKTDKSRSVLQKLYNQRSRAKAAGLPAPPLPKESAAA